jgi:hypothetical protein
MTTASEEIRARLTKRRDAARERMAELTDRISESRDGKLLAAAEDEVAECESILVLLPPAEPKPLPSSERASVQAVEPRVEDNLEMPGFLRRSA